MIYITQLTGRQEMFNARILTMIVAGFLLVILQSSIVQAQWATSGTNINNTNTGNVGIGTTAPGAKLDVKDTNNFQVTPNQSAAGEFPTSVLINSKGAGLTLLPDGNGAVGPKLFLGYRDTAIPMWRSALEIANTSGMTKHRVDINYSRRLHTQVSAMATIFVVLRPSYHSGSHRIEVDVPHQFA